MIGLAKRDLDALTRRALVSTIITVALGATLASPPTPRLVWNVSASAPRGLYFVTPNTAFHRGDMVVAWPPRAVRSLAAERQYLPLNVPLIKRVAAVTGERVCASNGLIQIGADIAALRRRADWLGRPLPFWTGCRTLNTHEILLLMNNRLSFDGRYFGPSQRSDVIGRAQLLWAR